MRSEVEELMGEFVREYGEMGEKNFWERMVFWGGRLETKLNMPSFMKTMRKIIMLWVKDGDLKEAKMLGEKIWADSEMLYYGLLRASNDPKLPTEEQNHAIWLAEVIERFQHLMIRELGVMIP